MLIEFIMMVVYFFLFRIYSLYSNYGDTFITDHFNSCKDI